MYRIGIIDDSLNEREDAEVSIRDNAGRDTELDFKGYELKSRTKEALLKEIEQDIEENYIHTLIVDFKLDTTADVIEGWEIIDYMRDELSAFPVVIMSNDPEGSRESEYTDADKVYAKRVFLNPELEETKVLVQNIMLNMKKYIRNRENLEGHLLSQLPKLGDYEADETVLRDILDTEEELGRYKPMNRSSLDTADTLDELKDIFELLKKYETL